MRSLVAFRAGEEGHVLYEAQDVDIDSPEHVDAFYGVFCSQCMWSGDNYRPYNR